MTVIWEHIGRLKNRLESSGSQTFVNMVFLLAGDWGRRLTGIAFTVIVARTLGPKEFGEYGLAQDLAILLGTLLDLGLAAFLIREIARDNNAISKYVNGALSLRILASVLVFTLALLFADRSDYSSTVIILIGLEMGWIITDNLSRVFRRSLMAIDRMDYEALLNIAFGVANLILASVALGLGFGVIGVAASDIIAGILILIATYVIFYRLIKTPFKFKIDWAMWRSWMVILLPLASIQLIISIWSRVSSPILIQYHSESAVGILTAVSRLINMIIPFAVYQVVANTPRLAKLSRELGDAFTLSASRQLKWVIYVGLVTGLSLSVGAPLIIQLIYGSAYEAAIPLLRIMAWNPLLYGMGYSLVYTLIAQDKQVAALVVSLPPLGIFIGISLVFVPTFSYIGSGWSIMLGFLVWVLCLLFYAIIKDYIRVALLWPEREDINVLYGVLKRR